VALLYSGKQLLSQSFNVGDTSDYSLHKICKRQIDESTFFGHLLEPGAQIKRLDISTQEVAIGYSIQSRPVRPYNASASHKID